MLGEPTSYNYLDACIYLLNKYAYIFFLLFLWEDLVKAEFRTEVVG